MWLSRTRDPFLDGPLPPINKKNLRYNPLEGVSRTRKSIWGMKQEQLIIRPPTGSMLGSLLHNRLTNRTIFEDDVNVDHLAVRLDDCVHPGDIDHGVMDPQLARRVGHRRREA